MSDSETSSSDDEGINVGFKFTGKRGCLDILPPPGHHPRGVEKEETDASGGTGGTGALGTKLPFDEEEELDDANEIPEWKEEELKKRDGEDADNAQSDDIDELVESTMSAGIAELTCKTRRNDEVEEEEDNGVGTLASKPNPADSGVPSVSEAAAAPETIDANVQTAPPPHLVTFSDGEGGTFVLNVNNLQPSAHHTMTLPEPPVAPPEPAQSEEVSADGENGTEAEEAKKNTYAGIGRYLVPVPDTPKLERAFGDVDGARRDLLVSEESNPKTPITETMTVVEQNTTIDTENIMVERSFLSEDARTTVQNAMIALIEATRRGRQDVIRPIEFDPVTGAYVMECAHSSRLLEYRTKVSVAPSLDRCWVTTRSVRKRAYCLAA